MPDCQLTCESKTTWRRGHAPPQGVPGHTAHRTPTWEGRLRSGKPNIKALLREQPHGCGLSAAGNQAGTWRLGSTRTKPSCMSRKNAKLGVHISAQPPPDTATVFQLQTQLSHTTGRRKGHSSTGADGGRRERCSLPFATREHPPKPVTASPAARMPPEAKGQQEAQRVQSYWTEGQDRGHRPGNSPSCPAVVPRPSVLWRADPCH